MPKIFKRVGTNIQNFCDMKSYKKVEVVAVNAPSGSYAAGCPEKNRGGSSTGDYSCINCERTK